MPYIIAIILVAVAALVFFSRPDTMDSTPATTTEAPMETPAEQTTDTDSDIILETNAAADVEASADIPDTPPIEVEQLATLTAEASYQTPARQTHVIDVTFNMDGNIITDAAVLYNDGDAKTPQHKAFEANYRDEVIGKDIDGLSLSRVGGSSLTTAAFNEAVAKIKAQL